MPKVRKILKPAVEGKNVTLAQAREAFRELQREHEERAKKAAARSTSRSAKAG